MTIRNYRFPTRIATLLLGYASLILSSVHGQEDSQLPMPDVNWGDPPKIVIAALGEPDGKGFNPVQQLILKYMHGDDNGWVAFVFDGIPERQNLEEEITVGELALILVVSNPYDPMAMSSLTREKLPDLDLGKADGFLGAFLLSNNRRH